MPIYEFHHSVQFKTVIRKSVAYSSELVAHFILK